MLSRTGVLGLQNRPVPMMPSNHRTKDNSAAGPSQVNGVKGRAKIARRADTHNDSNGSNAENEFDADLPSMEIGTPSKRSRLAESTEFNSMLENGQSPGVKRRVRSFDDNARKRIKRLDERANEMANREQNALDVNGSGVIKSIRLFNFMCHKSFEQKWHGNLNFVTGENGSGKSALLSGIIIGLGGKASCTSRTSSVKDLIKTGANHARTEIVLANNGKLPFDKYGTEVTIQRTINSTGVSQYRMKTGLESSFKPINRQALTAVLSSLDINFENPVVILNQEYARSFLRSKDPKDKYKLFEDGTGTAECDKMREDVEKTLEEISERVEEKEKEVQNIKEIYDDCKEKVRIIRSIDEQQDLLGKLNCELHWYYVNVEEEKEKEKSTALDVAEKKLAKTTSNLEKSQKALEEFENQTLPPETLREERAKRKRELQARRQQISKVYNDLMSAKVKIEMACKNIDAALRERKVHLAKLKLKLDKADQEDKTKHTELMEEFNRKKNELERRIKDVEPKMENIQREIGIFRDGLRNLQQKYSSKQAEMRQINDQINIKSRQLSQLNASKPSYVEYGQCMETLVDKLQMNQRQFSKPPRGPLGALITVKLPEYQDIIDFALKDVIRDFVVDNLEDCRKLSAWIKNVYGDRHRPRIHVMKYMDAYDVRQTNVGRPGIPSILDALDFDNNDPIVRNALIDFSSVERILLFKSSDDANDMMKDRRQVPPGCIYGFSQDWYKIFPEPNYRCNAIYNYRRRNVNYIKTSKQTQKERLQQEIQELREELKAFEGQNEEKEDETRIRSKIIEKEEELNNIRQENLKLKQQLNILQPPRSQLMDFTSLREEHEETSQDVQSKEAELEDLKIALEGKQASLDEKKEERQEVDKELDKIDEERRQEEEQAEQINQKKQTLLEFIQRYERALTQASDVVNSCKADLVNAKRKVADATEKAIETGARIQTKRASAEIKTEFDRVKANLTYLHQFKEKHAEIFQRYKAVKKRYAKFLEDLRVIQNMKQEVIDYFYNVNANYLAARDTMVRVLKDCYAAIASTRKYYGKLEIDHENRELYYLVCPDKDSLEKVTQCKESERNFSYKKRMVEYAAGLSGGERSFATLCFIIAMWQVMKSPFYMLDEFDVFMDAQNRAVSQEALMSHAKLHPNNQFFFFTPLDLTAVPSDRDALILRLFPPERRENGAAVASSSRS